MRMMTLKGSTLTLGSLVATAILWYALHRACSDVAGSLKLILPVNPVPLVRQRQEYRKAFQRLLAGCLRWFAFTPSIRLSTGNLHSIHSDLLDDRNCIACLSVILSDYWQICLSVAWRIFEAYPSCLLCGQIHRINPDGTWSSLCLIDKVIPRSIYSHSI